MEDYDIMTREEAERKMEVLRQIFPIVRLVRGYAVMDLDGKTGIMEDQDEMETVPHCECFAFWQKNKPCSNCISQRMMEEHGQTSKLEFLGEEMYQVTARYVEIDGEPYVMEMLQKQDGKNFIDEDGCKKLIGSLMKYKHMVYMDALTGVYNRRYFEDEIKNKTNTAGVAVIDMDYLKVINDTYGHRAGDHAIEMMVNVIRQNIRKTDSLIRYGGDEFLLILPEISKESFNEKLKKIQEKIHDTAIADYGNLRLSVSIGGVITRDGESIEEAVLRADRLMYFAKDQKNMVITEEKTGYLDETMREYLRTQTIKPKILIVDDSDMNRELLTEILKQDYELLEAENGEAALKMLEQYGTGIALVMLDLVMPKMDGFQVLTVMNERRLLEDIPVIMISSEDSGKYISEAYGFGVSDYIRRPFDARVVYQRVLNTIKLYSKQRLLHVLPACYLRSCGQFPARIYAVRHGVLLALPAPSALTTCYCTQKRGYCTNYCTIPPLLRPSLYYVEWLALCTRCFRDAHCTLFFDFRPFPSKSSPRPARCPSAPNNVPKRPVTAPSPRRRKQPPCNACRKANRGP